ncbi:MAG: hypothetical protein RLZZ94_1310, partial [Bacteroidota bacterium]
IFKKCPASKPTAVAAPPSIKISIALRTGDSFTSFALAIPSASSPSRENTILIMDACINKCDSAI